MGVVVKWDGGAWEGERIPDARTGSECMALETHWRDRISGIDQTNLRYLPTDVLVVDDHLDSLGC